MLINNHFFDNHVPEELFLSIIEYLTLQDCVQVCSLVSKAWHRSIFGTPRLWKHYYSIHFPLLPTPVLTSNTSSSNVTDGDDDDDSSSSCSIEEHLVALEMLKQQIHYQRRWQHVEQQPYVELDQVHDEAVKIIRHLEDTSGSAFIYENPVFISCSSNVVLWVRQHSFLNKDKFNTSTDESDGSSNFSNDKRYEEGDHREEQETDEDTDDNDDDDDNSLIMMMKPIPLYTHADHVRKMRWSNNRSDWMTTTMTNDLKDMASYPSPASLNDHLLVTCSWDSSICFTRFTLENDNESSTGELMSLHIQWQHSFDTVHLDRVMCLSQFCHLSSDHSILIASGSSDETIAIFRIVISTADNTTVEHIQTLTGHSSEIQRVLFLSPYFLASCSRDKTICIWSRDQESCIQVIHYPCGVYMLDYSYSGSYLCAGTYDGKVHIYKVKFDHESSNGSCSATLLHDLQGHSGRIVNMKLKQMNRSGKILLVTGSKDLSVRIWDVQTGQAIQCYDIHGGIPTGYDYDEEKLVTGCYDQVVRVFYQYENKADIAHATVAQLSRMGRSGGYMDVHVNAYEEDITTSVSFVRSQLVSGCGDGKVIIWPFFYHS